MRRVVKALRKATDATLDVHLMISNPDQYLDDFIKAGSDIITVHYEANGDTLAQVRKIKEAGVRACVSIKPGTPADVLLPLLPELDMVLIMTVEPGFGGQGYIDACTDKIRTIRKAIDENGYKCELEIDGRRQADQHAGHRCSRCQCHRCRFRCLWRRHRGKCQGLQEDFRRVRK